MLFRSNPQPQNSFALRLHEPQGWQAASAKIKAEPYSPIPQGRLTIARAGVFTLEILTLTEWKDVPAEFQAGFAEARDGYMVRVEPIRSADPGLGY
jgi:hypothetical protein